MKPATLKEIKSSLQTADQEALLDICLRLAKYKTENKELLTYLLFEAHNESGYIEYIKEEIAEGFNTLPRGNTYYIKKSLRKILRLTNRQIKYSGIKQTEIELRIYFCRQMKDAHIPMIAGTVLFNLYQQQLKKVTNLIRKLPEDTQYDYQRDLDYISKS